VDPFYFALPETDDFLLVKIKVIDELQILLPHRCAMGILLTIEIDKMD